MVSALPPCSGAAPSATVLTLRRSCRSPRGVQQILLRPCRRAENVIARRTVPRHRQALDIAGRRARRHDDDPRLRHASCHEGYRRRHRLRPCRHGDHCGRGRNIARSAAGAPPSARHLPTPRLPTGFFKTAFGAELHLAGAVNRIRKFDSPVWVFVENHARPDRGAQVRPSGRGHPHALDI